MAKKVLGKGLSAIISDSQTPVDDIERVIQDKDRIVMIETGSIKPNPDQPRSGFDDAGIRGLAESIKSAGLLQPIIVRRSGKIIMLSPARGD